MALKYTRMRAGDGMDELVLVADMPVSYRQIDLRKEEIASFILEKTGKPYMLRVTQPDGAGGGKTWTKEDFNRNIHTDITYE